MGTLYFIIAFVIVLAFYAYSNLRLKKDYVLVGDSFSSKNLTPSEVKAKSYYMKHKIYKDTAGNIINPDSMIHLFVSGNSLSPINVKSGDVVIVIKIDKKIPLNKQIKKNDVILIYLEDIGIYKLRAFYGFEGEGILTFYYNDNIRIMSSQIHKPESIRGIVKFKVIDSPVTQMSQQPFEANNDDYRRLSEDIKALENEIQRIRGDIEKYPEDEELGKRLCEKEVKRERLVEKFGIQQDTLLSTAKLIAESQHQQVSEKLQKAIDAFETGKLDEANRLLDELQKTGDQLAEEISTKHEQLHKYIEALRLQTETVMADVSISIEGRIARVAEIYAKADDWAERSVYDKEKYEKLLFDYAQFLNYYSHYQEAEQIYLRQIALSELLFGKESTNIAWSYNNIGEVYSNLAKYNKALEYHQKAFGIRKKVLGTDHLDTAQSYDNLGEVYDYQGDYDKALEYYQKALKIFEKILGVEHLDTATSYNNIGAVYDEQGDYVRALDYYQKALKIFEKVLGTEHPDTAASYNNIGTVYDDQGDYDKALEYYQKALAIHEKVLGVDHTITATSYNNIGLVYYHKGNYDKALEYYQKALKIFEKVLGNEHPDTATSYNNIGGVYKSQSNYSKAIDYYQEALEIREKVMGIEHPDTATSYNNIGTVYDVQGNYDKALKYYQKALAIYKKVLGVDHTITATSYNNIGLVYYHQGHYDMALEFLGKTLDILKRVLGSNHPNTKTVQRNIDSLKVMIIEESRVR